MTGTGTGTATATDPFKAVTDMDLSPAPPSPLQRSPSASAPTGRQVLLLLKLLGQLRVSFEGLAAQTQQELVSAALTALSSLPAGTFR